jgi:hypothetical protein
MDEVGHSIHKLWDTAHVKGDYINELSTLSEETKYKKEPRCIPVWFNYRT